MGKKDDSLALRFSLLTQTMAQIDAGETPALRRAYKQNQSALTKNQCGDEPR